MTLGFKLTALALTAALLCLTVRKQAPELALGLSLCACAMAGAAVVSWLEPVLDLARELAGAADLDAAQAGALWKCLGLGLVTEVAATLCADAGENALGKLVELGGGVLCLCLSLPLVRGVLALIRDLL